MKKLRNLSIILIIISSMVMTGCISSTIAREFPDTYYKVELDPVLNGSISIDPPLPEDGMVKAGTVLHVTATPDAGYTVDSIYKMIWIMEQYNYGYFMESVDNKAEILIDPADARFQVYGPSDVYKIGASFIKESVLEGIKVTQNVEYAKPGDKSLVYDVYAPNGAKNLPGVIIIHGGGWSSNTEDIMRGMAREIAKTGKYVAFAIDYRLLSDINTDGSSAESSVVDTIEDVFGAIAHIQKKAKKYGVDPQSLAVTGDSAGGHLAAVVTTMSHMVGTSGFNGTDFEFWPTGVKERDVNSVRENIMSAVKVSAPSYGVFNLTEANLEQRPNILPKGADVTWIKQLSPQTHIPSKDQRVLPPQMCQVGTEDFVVPPAGVVTYTEELKNAGQTVEFVSVPGAGHAYFDWKPDSNTKNTFNTTGKTYLNKILAFFDKYL